MHQKAEQKKTPNDTNIFAIKHELTEKSVSLSWLILRQMRFLIIGLVALILLAFLGLTQIYEAQVRKISTDQSIQIITHSVSPHLEFFDFLTLQINVTELKNSFGFERIEIFDRYDYLRAEAGMDKATKPDYSVIIQDGMGLDIGLANFWGDPAQALTDAIYALTGIGLALLSLLLWLIFRALRHAAQAYLIAPLDALRNDIANGLADPKDFSPLTRSFNETNEIAEAYSVMWRSRENETQERLKAITARQKASEQRLSQFMTFQNVLNQVSLAISYKDFDGNIVSLVDKKAPFLIKNVLAKPEANAENIVDIVHKFGGTIETAYSSKEFEKKATTRSGYVMRVNIDHKEYWSITKLVIDDDQQIMFAVNDTELRRVENELNFKQKMEGLGALASGVAHDFNNIIAIIMASTEIALEKTPENVGSELNSILSASKRAQNIVSQLLAFSNKSQSDTEIINSTEIISNLNATIPAMIGPKYQFEAKQDKKLYAWCNQSMLEAALVNFIVNARDASPEGGLVALHVREVNNNEKEQQKLPIDQDYIAFTVADQGCGVNPKIRDRLFDPFFSTKAPGAGTGLGLSLTYNFAKKNGGALYFTEANPSGTKFHLILPAHQFKEDAPKVINQNIVSENLVGKTLMILDDEIELARSICKYTTNLGIVADYFGDFSALLEAIDKNNPPDILLTDLHLKGDNGFKVIEYIKQKYPTVICIIMSGNIDENLAENNQHRPDAIAYKPFRLKEITQIFQSFYT